MLKNCYILLICVQVYMITCYFDNFDEIKDLFKDMQFTGGDFFDGSLILEEDESKIFDTLSEDEKKSRFGEIIDKMDKDHDNQVSSTELKNWMKAIHEKKLIDDVETYWERISPENSETISFQKYFEHTFGKKLSIAYEKLHKLEKKKWEIADLDKDDLLNKTEFLRFLHPTEFEEMKPIVAEELLDSMDKNKDSFLDINEYLAEIFSDMKKIDRKLIDDENSTFQNELDINKDGVLDAQEVQRWQLPDSYNKIEEEVRHIMKLVDTDRNELLSKTEMLDNYNIFLKSKKSEEQKSTLGHEEL